MSITTNRWFTSTGKAKRVPDWLKRCKKVAQENKPELMSGNVESIAKYVARVYKLGLAERWQFVVAFVGVYDNKHWAFTTERHDQGEKLIKGMDIWGI